MERLAHDGVEPVHQHGDVHVAALAGDDGGAQHGAPAEQITHQLFRPCGGRVEDVTHDDLIGGQYHHDCHAQTCQQVEHLVQGISQFFHDAPPQSAVWAALCCWIRS